MKRGRLLILGASGHGKVIGDCARSTGLWNELVFYDDRYSAITLCGPWPVAGKCNTLFYDCREGDQTFVAIGNANTRLTWLRKITSVGIAVATIVHPKAVISPSAILGEGTVAVAGAIVNMDVSVGKGCILNTGSTVDHDCVLEDGVHICPGANLAGEVHIGSSSWIGIGSTVCQCLKIGARVTVGAGAVVTKNIMDDMTVVGVPARPQK